MNRPGSGSGLVGDRETGLPRRDGLRKRLLDGTDNFLEVGTGECHSLDVPDGREEPEVSSEVSRHLVERGRQLTKLVAALDLDRLIELTPRQAKRPVLELGQRLETVTQESVDQGENHQKAEDNSRP